MDAITLSTGRVLVLSDKEAMEVRKYFLRETDKKQCREYLEKMQNKLIHLDSGFAIIDENANRIRATVVAPYAVHYCVEAKLRDMRYHWSPTGRKRQPPWRCSREAVFARL